MKVDFTIKNYRAFEDTQPLRFTLEKGFTAFLGPNNSGKSSILKFFYEFRNVWQRLSDWNNVGIALGKKTFGFNGFIGVLDQQEVFCNLNTRDIEIELEPQFSGNGYPPITKIKIVITRALGLTLDIWINNIKTEIRDKPLQVKDSRLLLCESKAVTDLFSFLEFFKLISRAMYIGPFRNAINVGAASYFDINVGSAFIETWHQWKAGPSKAQSETIIKVTRDIQHIFEYSNLEITASKELNTLHIVADGKSYKLSELGGGIAQFIVAFGNAAISQPSIILIDEPELNLHPSLQLDFLTSLVDYSDYGVIFATHSLGLARSAADHIYSVKQNQKKSLVRPLEQTSDLAEFLGELNFASYRELGYDKVLLVEGVDDLRAIQQFLRFLKKDHKIVMLPLGGSQMINGSREIELEEIKRIFPNIAALIDSERENKDAPLSRDRKAFCDVCSKHAIEVHVLERRAFENYLSEKAIQTVKGSKYNALSPYQKVADSACPWAKNENWRIARAMDFEEIKESDLGMFLDKL